MHTTPDVNQTSQDAKSDEHDLARAWAADPWLPVHSISDGLHMAASRREVLPEAGKLMKQLEGSLSCGQRSQDSGTQSTGSRTL